MAELSFSTGSDIYLEVNGRRLAVAQGYKAKTTKESRYVEAFGSKEPVGTIDGKTRHVVELTRVYVTGGGQADKVDFFTLENFNVVIVRPDRKIIYSGCQWSDIYEAAQAGDLLFETVTIVASRRLEVAA